MGEYPIPDTTKIELKIIDIPIGSNLDYIENIGRKYIERNFYGKKSDSHQPSHFCRTKDGVWVFFKTVPIKLMGRNDGHNRVCEKSRVERLHWIKPIIEEETKETVLKTDVEGKILGQMGHRAIPGKTYRIYWVPKYKYVVFLISDSNKLKSFNLVSAYIVTKATTRKTLQKLFPIQKKIPAQSQLAG